MTTRLLLRNRPKTIESKAGIAVPAFIHNGSYFFTELDVYADGIVDCWGAVDLDFLARKLESGWISPIVPDGAKVSIHDLIQGKVVSGQWSYDRHSLHKRLLDCLQQLNPSMENLIDFQGSDVEQWGRIPYAKIGLTDAQPCQRSLDKGTRPYSTPTIRRYWL